MLTSRLLKVFASRTRFTTTLGAIVAMAAIAVPVAAGTASAATSAARPGASAAIRAPFPATMGAMRCWSLTNCMAVGANTPQMATQLIAERWNGSRWSRSTLPKPSGTAEVTIGGLACPSRTECVAVGAGYPPPTSKSGSFPVVERWNGSRWTASRAVEVGSDDILAAVSCPAVKSCYAVGSYAPKGAAFAPLVEHWNGATWSRQAVSVPRGTSDGMLTALSCSSAALCVAVGSDGSGVLIERWNGRGWWLAASRSAPSASLYGVSCPSATSCFAVGSSLTASGGSLVERWNGKSWSASTTPVPRKASYAGLQSVSCVSAAHCLAVGNDVNPGVYAAAWNGHGWHLVAMTTTGGHIGAFTAVTCLTATSCVALTATTQFAASARSEAAFWNGTRWKVVRTA
ncbi:MAG TPA: hypothetical protein VHZ33_20680 [Trebonia sp.]|nr:hypothetical protein [Trebonia sp.]